jgi:Poxvirus A32 protein
MDRSGNWTLNIKKFDMNSIKDDSIVVLVGKRNTGKSFLIRDIMHNKKDIPIATAISPTEMANKFYGDFIPPMFIHQEYNTNILKKIIHRQKKLTKRIQKGENDIDRRTVFIMDDCLYDSKGWVNDKYIRCLFMNGRHFGMMYLLTMQYALGIPPQLRTQIDYVFILRDNVIANRKRLYEQYAGFIPNFDMFCRIMDQCTENYECLVIHNGSKSNKIEDQIFWYKAEPHASFTMCPPEIWEYSRNHYNEDEDSLSDDDENGGIASMRKGKKNDFSVRVRKAK